MIGNTIEFYLGTELKEGLVVDAYTKISGKTTGKNESFMGFGSGSVSGKTDSKRMYKVQYFKDKWDKEKNRVSYVDIWDTQLSRIISFSNNPQQEINEEKILK